MNRIMLAKLAGLITALALAACNPAANPVSDADMSMGPATAKVTVVEYASTACPICAQWNNENFPAFKTKYIDTGRVRYVLREALTHDPAIAAAGFMVARCAGKDKYFAVVDAIYHARNKIEASGAPRDELAAIARANGMNEDQFQACISDPKALAAIRQRWEGYMKNENINGTPAFVINGKQYTGDPALEQMDGAIVAAEKAAL